MRSNLFNITVIGFKNSRYLVRRGGLHFTHCLHSKGFLNWLSSKWFTITNIQYKNDVKIIVHSNHILSNHIYYEKIINSIIVMKEIYSLLPFLAKNIYE